MRCNQLPVALLLALAASAGATDTATSLGKGASLAFVSIRTGDAHIWVRDGDGVERMLTSEKGVNTSPSLSVQGRLAFVSRSSSLPQVFVMDEDGSGRRRVSEAQDRIESAPSWSPDGRSLAFYSAPVQGGTVELHIVDMTSKAFTIVSGGAGSKGPAAPSWSVDGRRLSFLGQDGKGRSQVWVAERDGSGLREISSKFAQRGAGWADLSPDGKQVVWVADMREKGSHIVVTELASGASRDLTADVLAGHESPRWSPDGRQIVFASNRGDAVGGRSDIFAMNADGSQLRNLSRHESEDFDPRWSGDGSKIVFVSLRGSSSLLFEVDVASGVPRQLSQHSSHDMEHVSRPIAALR